MSGFTKFLGANFAFLALQWCLVCCDITDGNAEHLKREHSLMKPYQGETFINPDIQSARSVSIGF